MFSRTQRRMLFVLPALMLVGTPAFADPTPDAPPPAAAAPHLLQGQFANQEELLHSQNFGKKADVHAAGLPATQGFFKDYAPPTNFTTFGHRIDWLFRYTSWVAFVFFCVMAFALVLFVSKYRARPGHKAFYTKGIDRSSTTVTRLLDIAVFVTLDLVLLFSSFRDTRDIVWNYPTGPDAVKVMVYPQQWAWNFRYAGKDGAFNTPDDIITVNEMNVPKNRPILIQIMSKDVIHGFFVPNARIQIDAIPGQVSKFWFDANTTGNFEIACYHLCGTAHYKMKAFLQVMEEEDFKLWSEENSRWAVAKFDPEDKSAQWGWEWGL